MEKIPGAQPDGFLVNVPFLIQGDKEAHIVLSETDKPNWEVDNVYEFVVGGWGDTKAVIRRRRGRDVLQEELVANSISKAQPTKFVISINKAGFVVVYNDITSYKPVVWANDPDPLKLKFISFASNASEVIDYYYDCPEFYTRTAVIPGLIQGETHVVHNTTTMEILEVHHGEESQVRPDTTIETIVEKVKVPSKPVLPTFHIHTLLQDTRLYDNLNIRKLSKYSVTFEAWSAAYEQLIPMTENMRPKGYMLQFVVYIQGNEGARILLSPGGDMEAVDEDPNVYEVQIGVEGNSWSQIVKKSTGDVVARTFNQNLLSEERPLRVVVEISNCKYSIRRNNCILFK